MSGNNLPAQPLPRKGKRAMLYESVQTRVFKDAVPPPVVPAPVPESAPAARDEEPPQPAMRKAAARQAELAAAVRSVARRPRAAGGRPLHVVIPENLWRQLEARRLEWGGVPMRAMLLHCLRQCGFSVDDAEIADRRLLAAQRRADELRQLRQLRAMAAEGRLSAEAAALIRGGPLA